MITNRKGVTIYEKTVQNRAPTYIRHTTGAVWLEASSGQENGSDRKPDKGIFLSIPEASLSYVPKPGDLIVGEMINDEQPPVTAMTVMSVKDYRHGSPFVQHIEVNAE
jgi:hypothetical protein rflaF_05839